MKLINTYHRPLPTEGPNGGVCSGIITAVLTVGAVNDYAVYIGDGNEEWVMKYGVKLCYEEALHYFPGLVKSEYRR